MRDVRRVAAELLAERDRHGVLQMRAPGLEHAGERAALSLSAVGERASPTRARPGSTQQDRQARRGREDVVRGLPHVDVVVGVHALVGAARPAEQLAGAVGEHLVRVHVVRRAGAGLIDVDDELVAQLAGEDLVRGARRWRRRPARSRRPSGALARRAAFLIRTVAVTSVGGAVRPLIGKFSTARWVCTP